MILFTKNVEFHEESWDFGNNQGFGVSVGDPPLLRLAVSARTKGRVLVEPEIRETVRVDINGIEDVPAVPSEDEDYAEPIKILMDSDGNRFYWREVVVKPATWRAMTPDESAEAKERATAELHRRLEYAYQAGLLLAEGRVDLRAVSGQVVLRNREARGE